MKKNIILFISALYLLPCLAAGEDFAFKGTVKAKEEIWDRRPNSLMGRPDILKEIVLSVRAWEIVNGSLPGDTGLVSISVKGEKNIIEYKTIRVKDEGIFFVTGDKSPYELLSFETTFTSTPEPVKPVYKPTPAPFPLNIGAKQLLRSPELKKKALRAIAVKYGMKKAKIITLTSFSGPCPPDGGYVYWGVKGLINGKWHVWQPWENNNKPFPGVKLTDPQRYQK